MQNILPPLPPLCSSMHSTQKIIFLPHSDNRRFTTILFAFVWISSLRLSRFLKTNPHRSYECFCCLVISTENWTMPCGRTTKLSSMCSICSHVCIKFPKVLNGKKCQLFVSRIHWGKIYFLGSIVKFDGCRAATFHTYLNRMPCVYKKIYADQKCLFFWVFAG